MAYCNPLSRAHGKHVSKASQILEPKDSSSNTREMNYSAKNYEKKKIIGGTVRQPADRPSLSGGSAHQ